MLYSILIICIVFLAYRFLIYPKGRSNKTKYILSFKEAVDPVEMKMAEKFKQIGFHVDHFRRMINDKSQGIILAYDANRDMFSIGMMDSLLIEEGKRLHDIEKRYDIVDKRNYGCASISFMVDDSTYTYDISTHPFNPKGFVERTIYEITEDFYNDLKNIENVKRS